SLKTSIKTITYLSDTGCLEIQGASLVMGGMVTATVLAIFFVPVFFVVVRRRFSRKNEDIEHSHTVDHH
uniref:hypothetical protein n=1 Tax=Escherichia coli TaxID=562 RepID=UPI001CDA9ACD